MENQKRNAKGEGGKDSRSSDFFDVGLQFAMHLRKKKNTRKKSGAANQHKNNG